MKNSRLFLVVAIVAALSSEVMANSWTDQPDVWAAQDINNPVPQNAVLFVGSSSIRRWQYLCQNFAEYDIIQRGYGSSRITHTIDSFDKIVGPYNPQAVVMFAGTNDIHYDIRSNDDYPTTEAKATEVYDRYLTFAGQLANEFGENKPDFFYIGITPCKARTAEGDIVSAANAKIQSYAATQDWLHYIDTPTALMSSKQYPPEAGTNYPSTDLFYSDNTHLNEAGYEIFSSTIKTAVSAVVAPKTYTANPLTPQVGKTIRFDFGPSNAEDGDHTPTTNGVHWNNWHDTNGNDYIFDGERKSDLVDTEGNNTGIDLVITGSFESNGKLNGGLLNPSEENLGDMAVATATEDYFFSRSNGDTPGGFMLTGLNPNLAYNFKFFGSRTKTTNQTTEYTIVGAETQTELLQVSGSNIGADGAYDANDDTFAIFENVKPDEFGQLFIDVEAAVGDYGYLGAMEITAVPEPATTSLLILSGLSLLVLRRRRHQ